LDVFYVLLKAKGPTERSGLMNSIKINYGVNKTLDQAKRQRSLPKQRKSGQSSGFLRKPDIPPCRRMPLPDLQLF
jgi:hypothetical protein